MMVRKLLLAVLTAAMLVALVPGAPASAHVCYRDSCTGLDPNDAGCSWDARTVQEYNYYGVNYEMRFSSYCDAVWTRVWSPENTSTIWGQVNGYNCYSKACRWIQYGVQAQAGTRWTKMIGLREYSPRIFQTCSAASHSGDPRYCGGFVTWG